MASFVAIDFETANGQRNSACAVALVRVRQNRISQKAEFLIRPPVRLFQNTRIHGITWADVAGAPTFGELWPKLKPFFSGVDFIAAHYAPFDRSVLNACCACGGIDAPNVEFKCSMQIAREIWGLYPTKLPDVAKYLGIPLVHHDAGSDANVCADCAASAGQVETIMAATNSSGKDAAPEPIPQRHRARL